MTSDRVDYDQIAATYDRRYEERPYEGVERALRAWLATAPPGRFLEVGCGTGYWLSVLPLDDRRVFGLDRSAGMLARARRKGCSAFLVHAEATRLPFDDGSMTALLCMNALHHFPDKPAFIAEAARVLRPGGVFCTVGLDPHRGSPRWAVYDYFEGTRATDEARYPSHQQIVRWLGQSGFTGCGSRAVEHLHRRRAAEEVLGSPMTWKNATSQLALLSDEAYTAGLDRIRAASARARAEGRMLYLETDLELMATTGRLGPPTGGQE
jgi:ubiquinone/menaquinone biosynthesis C-methylase UbiE